ncbi:MAG: AAA domain-containing protein [Candidatus Latescibacteria bacterium]|nr:AAA domain-containing protein [Candidatus Latescibacterota bacterium]
MLRNPYLNRSMIRSLDRFFGRQSHIERIMGRLDSPTPQSVALVGERRTGKSSLLWHLGQEEIYSRYLQQAPDYVFCYLDFQRQQQLDQQGFCRVFGEELNEAAGGRFTVPKLTDFPALEGAVQQLQRQGLRIVCLCDEFETVTRNPLFGPEFYGLLRSLANAFPIAFITASNRDLQELCHKSEVAESPFFNIFSQVHLGPLTPTEARLLVAQPSRAAGLPLEEHFDALCQWGGHLPFFLQIACSAVFETCTEGGGQWNWDGVAKRFMEEGAVHFRYLWAHFDEEQQQLLAQLVQGGSPSGEQKAVLLNLERDGYILRGEGSYQLFSKGLDPYIEKLAPAAPTEPVPDPAEPAEAPGLTAHANPALAPLPPGEKPYPALIGHSEPMRRIFALIQKTTAADVTVLLLGETGVGKELVARTIHQHSRRQEGPFMALNCGAVAEHLLESELFGHKRGSFTGSTEDRQGLFEAANGGTLFLDEIGETDAATQVKLLRVLQEGEIRRVGENRPRQIDVRLICATNRPLEEEVAQGRFRQDLYFRLYVLALELPPLRSRREDIPALVEHFLQGYEPGISPQAHQHLLAYTWPGNIRELENQLLSAGALAGGQQIEVDHLWPRVSAQGAAPAAAEGPIDPEWTLPQGREYFERRFIGERLASCGGDLAQAATSLGISRSRLYQLVERYGLKKD